MCLINRCLFSASAVIRSWLICELQKSTTRNSLYSFYCINMCLINRCLFSASAVIRSWLICELQKSTTRNSLYSFYSRNPTCEIPPCLRISNRQYPPSFRIPVQRTPPPSPSEILKAIRGMGMDIFWNHPLCPYKYDMQWSRVNQTSLDLFYTSLWWTALQWCPPTLNGTV